MSWLPFLAGESFHASLFLLEICVQKLCTLTIQIYDELQPSEIQFTELSSIQLLKYFSLVSLAETEDFAKFLIKYTNIISTDTNPPIPNPSKQTHEYNFQFVYSGVCVCEFFPPPSFDACMHLLFESKVA